MASAVAMNRSKNGSAMVFKNARYVPSKKSRPEKRVFSTDQIAGKLLIARDAVFVPA